MDIRLISHALEGVGIPLHLIVRFIKEDRKKDFNDQVSK